MASRKRKTRTTKPMGMSDIKRAKDKLSRKVIDMPGVSGVAVGATRSGRPCLTVYVDGRSSGRRLPKTVLGLDVVVEETGSFKRQ